MIFLVTSGAPQTLPCLQPKSSSELIRSASVDSLRLSVNTTDHQSLTSFQAIRVREKKTLVPCSTCICSDVSIVIAQAIVCPKSRRHLCVHGRVCGTCSLPSTHNGYFVTFCSSSIVQRIFKPGHRHVCWSKDISSRLALSQARPHVSCLLGSFFT